MERDLNKMHERYLLIIKQLILMDDIFMCKVFEDPKCVELLLRIILKKDDLTVIRVVSQQYIKNLQGRSVKLDIYAVDRNGVHYNIEIQRADSGAVPERARYNSSIMDANLSFTGDDFTALPEIYVIFITENDVLEGGKPMYTINRKIEELKNAPFADRSHIIYVNGSYRASDAIGMLMEDFFCADPKKMNYSALAERVRYFKEEQEGTSFMCKAMEDLINDMKEIIREEGFETGKAEGMAEGRAEGMAEEKNKMILNMLKDNFLPYEKISEYTNVPIDEVMKLAAANK